MRFIDQFDILLLDMSNTFMFDVDRFSEADDVGATYRRLGGDALSEEDVGRLISSAVNTMKTDYRNPHCYDNFPSVQRCLQALPEAPGLPERELLLLERVFAAHEVGTIPDTHVQALRHLHKTHRLGAVSNIWSKSDLYLKEFVRAGIHQLFDVILFSSDYGRMKPSAYLFRKAIAAFAEDRSRMVFVGDSLRCDVAGARGVGLSTVWIASKKDTGCDADPVPDLVIQDLRDLSGVGHSHTGETFFTR